MTDAELKAAFVQLEKKDGKIATQLVILEREQAAISKQMEELEHEWLVTHGCLCGLLDIDCVHASQGEAQ